MCDCLDYEDGSMYLCESCASMWREFLAGRYRVVKEDDLIVPLIEAQDRPRKIMTEEEEEDEARLR